MNKEDKEIKINKLVNKTKRLTRSLFKEQKSNIYNKNMNLLIVVNQKIESLRKIA